MYVLGEGSLSCEAVDLAADIVEIEEEDDYIYCRNKEGMLCRFSTEGVVENVLCTFGFQANAELDFEDMRRRIGDPEVCVWIPYDQYINLNQTVL
jgi:hypothetical protein